MINYRFRTADSVVTLALPPALAQAAFLAPFPPDSLLDHDPGGWQHLLATYPQTPSCLSELVRLLILTDYYGVEEYYQSLVKHLVTILVCRYQQQVLTPALLPILQQLSADIQARVCQLLTDRLVLVRKERQWLADAEPEYFAGVAGLVGQLDPAYQRVTASNQTGSIILLGQWLIVDGVVERQISTIPSPVPYDGWLEILRQDGDPQAYRDHEAAWQRLEREARHRVRDGDVMISPNGQHILRVWNVQTGGDDGYVCLDHLDDKTQTTIAEDLPWRVDMNLAWWSPSRTKALLVNPGSSLVVNCTTNQVTYLPSHIRNRTGSLTMNEHHIGYCSHSGNQVIIRRLTDGQQQQLSFPGHQAVNRVIALTEERFLIFLAGQGSLQAVVYRVLDRHTLTLAEFLTM